MALYRTFCPMCAEYHVYYSEEVPTECPCCGSTDIKPKMLSKQMMFAVPGGSTGYQANQTIYVAWHGAYGTEEPAQVQMPVCKIKKFSMRVSTNTLLGATVITLRKNGIDTSNTLTIPAETTGLFEADWEEEIAEEDLLSLQWDIGGTGATGIFPKGGKYILLVEV